MKEAASEASPELIDFSFTNNGTYNVLDPAAVESTIIEFIGECSNTMRPNFSQPVPTIRSVIVLLACLLVVCGSVQAGQTEIVVARDGSGKFKTVQEAIMSVPVGTRENPVIIRIKPGRYKELIYVQREKRFFRLVGEDPYFFRLLQQTVPQ